MNKPHATAVGTEVCVSVCRNEKEAVLFGSVDPFL